MNIVSTTPTDVPAAVLTDPTSSNVSTIKPADERIAHRGPMRRWLISPEIGALIGAVVVWLFLWGNGETFSTAGTTLNWLDVAGPYGIMATAVALLMIGGEFDLSSGVITGATAMVIGLMARFFAGGMHLGFAILACFLLAGAVGWFNGYMVNRTNLPSFIITLSSFFVIRGLMLVLSKRLAGKVYVDEIQDQRGAPLLGKWIAHEWRLQEFSGRDALYVALVILGALIFSYGLLEQSFVRRDVVSAKALLMFGIGALVGAIGFAGLQRTDGVLNNIVFGALTAIGGVASIVGMALTRWQTRGAGHRGSGRVAREVAWQVGLGVGGLGVAGLVPLAFRRSEGDAVLTWVGSGLRPVFVVVAAAAGLALALISQRATLRGPKTHWIDYMKPAFFAVYSALLLTTIVVSAFQLMTVQALRAICMVLLSAGGLALLLIARGSTGSVNAKWQLVIGVTAAVAMVVIGLICRVDSSATRFRTVLPASMIVGASVLAANSLLEFLMVKRRFGDPKADRFGRRLQVFGGIAIVAGVALRLLFTNFTPEHAKRLADAGEPVPQNVLRQTVLWWLLVSALGAYVLMKTRWGNWIFAVGGNKEAARATGVPADRVKITLFVALSLCGALSGTLIALRYGTVQADQGSGNEFEYIIAAVVGGCLMTGGYGSVIGASIGAAILAMSSSGFQTVQGWNSDARYAFLGGVLLVAVLVNSYTRRKAMEAR